MGIINQLDFQTANLIAAGEVVDRPASACKELLENAIDAGAKVVTVEIKNGGVTFIRVSDNGKGMAREDVPIAIKRHATSKIRDARDLDAILTLGFRGEALAAISSVSHMRILTKRREDSVGTKLECEPGREPTLEEVAISDGTTVIAENLFENVPARRKFLKKDQTEAMAVTAAIEKVALSNPSVSVRLIIDGNLKFTTAGDGVLKNTIYALLGRDFANRMIELNRESDGIKITGYVGTPENIRANRNYQNFFINGRYVKSKCAQAALEQAFTSYISTEKFPSCVMNIEIPPNTVDVNVHPAKLEVKFSNERMIFEAVYYAVRGALESKIPRPQLDFAGMSSSEASFAMMKALGSDPKKKSPLNAFVPIEDGENRVKLEKSPYVNRANVKPGQLSLEAQLRGSEPIEAPAAEPKVEPKIETKIEPKPETKLPPPISLEELAGDPALLDGPPLPPEIEALEGRPSRRLAEKPSEPEKSAETEAPAAANPVEAPAPEPVEAPAKPAIPPLKPPPEYRIIGEAFYSYVFVEVGNKVLIIDKHAAHERIIFEELKRNLRTKTVVSQLLLIPVEVTMTSDELQAIEDYAADIAGIGFEVYRQDETTLAASAIPQQVEVSAVSDMLVTIAERLISGTGSVQISRDLLFEKALYQASCKAAIKAGRISESEHIKWICDKLLSLDDIKYCPHGRPVAFELSKANIEHQFKRT